MCLNKEDSEKDKDFNPPFTYVFDKANPGFCLLPGKPSVSLVPNRERKFNWGLHQDKRQQEQQVKEAL